MLFRSKKKLHVLVACALDACSDTCQIMFWPLRLIALRCLMDLALLNSLGYDEVRLGGLRD